MFEHAAALYGCGYERASDPESLRGAIESSLGGGTTIIEVRTDREQNLALHRRIAQAVTDELSEQKGSTDT
jgi:2-succinyl-5-enolpyruvyl-6-hydroxy-3-cyclohexene-1-carboxylate synthase